MTDSIDIEKAAQEHYSNEENASCYTTECDSDASKAATTAEYGLNGRSSHTYTGSSTTTGLAEIPASPVAKELSEALSSRASISTRALNAFASSPVFDELAKSAREESSERKSSLFCGSCCDLVKGCIIVNLLNICVSILFLAICLMDNDRLHELLLAVDDEDEDDEAGGLRRMLDPRGTLGLVRTSLMIPFALLGIVGAWRFQKYMVLCTAIWYVIDLFPAIMIRAWTNLVLSAFYCYPHIHLFLELKRGKMTLENYKSTEQHCCCAACPRTSKDGGGVSDNHDLL